MASKLGVQMDAAQNMMLLFSLKMASIGMNVGTGKTYPVVLDFMAKRILMRGEDCGILVADQARSQYLDTSGNYYKLLKMVGITAVDIVDLHEQGLSPRDMAGYYGNPEFLPVVSSTVQSHLVSQWTNLEGGDVLKAAMMTPAFITVDEFHTTLQLRTAAILAMDTRSFDPVNNSSDKEKLERCMRIFSALTSDEAQDALENFEDSGAADAILVCAGDDDTNGLQRVSGCTG